jgi:hypothetical protein
VRPPAPGSLAGIVVDTAVQGPRLPESFLGFSQEYTIVLGQVGTPEYGPNPVLVGLYRNLARFGSGVPALRVGGATTDTTWYDPSRGARPRGIAFTVTPRWLQGVGAFLRRTEAPAILGLNLGAGEAEIATNWARAARASLPNRPPPVFELGNEPDSYDISGVPGAPGETLRPAPYGPAAYLREATRFTRALGRLSPAPLLAGPALACRRDCTVELPQILARGGPKFALATVHRYELLACPGVPQRPTVAALLAQRSIGRPLEIMHRLVEEARQAGLPLRVTETNSVGCGGLAGVSNVFASALWGADWLFGMQAAGVSGADLHGSSPLYAPFRTGLRGGEYVGAVMPLYYGMLLFAEATAHRSRPLAMQVAAVGDGRRANVKAWAFHDAETGVVRVAVINKDLRLHGTVRVRIPGASGAATVKRLLAPGPAAAGGITWGGQHFPFRTRDAKLVGPRRIGRARRSEQDFTVDMPRASAALLTVPVRG